MNRPVFQPDEIPIWRRDGQPMGRAVEQVNTVEVMGAKEGLVVRPGEVLVLSFPGYTGTDELEIIRRAMMNAGLDGRFVLIGGQVNISKVEQDDAVDRRSRRAGGPSFRSPGQGQLLGSTVEGEVLP